MEGLLQFLALFDPAFVTLLSLYTWIIIKDECYKTSMTDAALFKLPVY